MGSEWEASDHTGGWAVDGDPTGKDVRLSLQGMRGHEPLARHRTKRCQDDGARRWWEPTDGPERARDKARNNKETGKNHGGDASDPRGEARPVMGTSSEGKNGHYHSIRKGWKHQEQLGGGPVGEPQWTRM